MDASAVTSKARRLLFTAAVATWVLLVVGIGVVVIVGVLVAWGVNYLEGRRRLDERATDLQQRIAEPISRDPRLRQAAVLPTATLAADDEATVVITGRVDSEDARRTVLEVARRVAGGAHVVDRLEVVSSKGRHAG